MMKNEGEASLSENAQSAGQDQQYDTDVVSQSASRPMNEHNQDKQLPEKGGLNELKNPANSRPEDNVAAGNEKAGTKPDPTRYGDWEKNGRCIDF